MTTAVVVACLLAVVGLAAYTLRLRREVGRLRNLVTADASTRPTPSRPVDDLDRRSTLPVPTPVPVPGELVLTPTPLRPGQPDPATPTARVASVTPAAPLIKVVALSSGLRRALGEESRMRIAYAFRKELRRQRRLRRRRHRAPARTRPVQGPSREAGWTG